MYLSCLIETAIKREYVKNTEKYKGKNLYGNITGIDLSNFSNTYIFKFRHAVHNNFVLNIFHLP